MGARVRVGVALLAGALLAGCSPGAPSTSPTRSADAGTPVALTGFVTGLNIPWAVGAMRYDRDGSIEYHPGDWPPFPVEAIRLWDSRTAWLDLEPANDLWDFRRLDRFIAKARAQGTDDITLVLAGTPRWAAGRVDDADAAWLGPGSASMPKQLTEWREFVSTVATKYRGEISAYEIGNEPNLAMFWSGTPEAYGAYVQTAASAIRSADPMATIVAGGPVVRDASDVPAIRQWLSPVMTSAGDAIDAVAVHLYPSALDLDETAALLDETMTELDEIAGRLPAWATELNVSEGSTLTDEQQGQAVTDLTQQAQDAGFDRAYWYAWTDLGPENLIQLWPGTPGAEALEQLAASERG